MTFWDDEDFRGRFRISKEVVLQVLGYIDDQISSQSERWVLNTTNVVNYYRCSGILS